MWQRPAKWTWFDTLFLAVVVGGGSWLLHNAATELAYKWQWEVIPQYLVRYDEQAGHWVPNLLLQGLLTTIRLSFWSTLLATCIGVVMGLFRVSPSLFKRLIAQSYVVLSRNLPPLVLVFLLYYFFSDQLLPSLGLQEMVGRFPPLAQKIIALVFAEPAQLMTTISAVVTLALYEGAYITEIVRSGIQSIERGQWEAAYALGLSKFEQLRYVILPQAVRRVIPPLTGQFISTIKDSAIVSVISVPELTFQGMELMAATYLTFEVWITVTVLYFLLTFSCSLLARRIEVFLQKRD
ncbi:amino acid ABC transporter permease [Desulfohalobium retbaense]|uniref:Polar amino acid ABC transporter, inner membrane subunit n=1 Tax=Desulfohalobium retbaense (strain ATCC 49708 / DSM 5692 / JCM 16813 / HR100) TaxID=485915 RepID=C8X0F0_DESRD|nr:amino acid ABC transporter permease [Desulfohalobium retbaense]ACV67775.1 polar amino acid ABC transporter, inner membrane subunit [Desulfohalobium retbaense DSM 5692]